MEQNQCANIEFPTLLERAATDSLLISIIFQFLFNKLRKNSNYGKVKHVLQCHQNMEVKKHE